LMAHQRERGVLFSKRSITISFVAILAVRSTYGVAEKIKSANPYVRSCSIAPMEVQREKVFGTRQKKTVKEAVCTAEVEDGVASKDSRFEITGLISSRTGKRPMWVRAGKEGKAPIGGETRVQSP